jgi:hypothetical protein
MKSAKQSPHRRTEGISAPFTSCFAWAGVSIVAEWAVEEGSHFIFLSLLGPET